MKNPASENLFTLMHDTHQIDVGIALNCRLFARISLIGAIGILPSCFRLPLPPDRIFLSSLSMFNTAFLMLNTLKCQDYFSFWFVARKTKKRNHERRKYPREIKTLSSHLTFEAILHRSSIRENEKTNVEHTLNGDDAMLS